MNKEFKLENRVVVIVNIWPIHDLKFLTPF